MPRRIVTVPVSASIFADMLFASLPGVYHRTDTGLPKGAKCIGRGYDWERDQFWFIFEHESFAEVPDGEMAPRFYDVRLSAFCFPAPLDEKAIAELNALVAKQVVQYLSDGDPVPHVATSSPNGTSP